MRTNGTETETEVVPRARPATARTRALAALDGFCDPQRPCIPGELLRTWHWCGRPSCDCGMEFIGTASHGTAAAGRVVELDVPRSAVVAALAAVVDRAEGGYAGAYAAAERLLDAVADLEPGRLVRREDDVIVAFPPDARVTGRHTISVG